MRLSESVEVAEASVSPPESPPRTSVCHRYWNSRHQGYLSWGLKWSKFSFEITEENQNIC